MCVSHNVASVLDHAKVVCPKFQLDPIYTQVLVKRCIIRYIGYVAATLLIRWHPPHPVVFLYCMVSTECHGVFVHMVHLDLTVLVMIRLVTI